MIDADNRGMQFEEHPKENSDLSRSDHHNSSVSLTAELTPIRAPKAKAKRIGRIFGIVALGLVLLMALVLTSLSLYLSNDRVEKMLSSIVREQISGHLSVRSLKFNLFTGLEVDGIVFTSGTSDVAPLFSADQLRVSYRSWRVFLGEIVLDEVVVVRPHLLLRKNDQGTNFDFVLAHRNQHFPYSEKPSPTPVTPLKLSQLLPFDPKALWSPLAITIGNVGFTDLKVEFESDATAEDQQALRFVIDGLTASVGARWHSSKSQLRVEIGNATPTTIHFHSGKNDTKALAASFDGRISAELQDILGLKFVSDIKQLAVDDNNRVVALKDIIFKTEMQFSESLGRIEVKSLALNMAEFLQASIGGTIDFPQDDFSVLGFDLNSDLRIDLGRLTGLANSIVPGTTMSGSVALEKLSLAGKLDTTKQQYPIANGVLKINSAEIANPELGFLMLPLDGSITVATGPELLTGNSQAEISAALTALGVHVTDNKSKTSLAIDDVNVDLIAKLTYPEINLPFLKLNLEAAHVIAGAAGMNEVDTPLYLTLNADARPGLKRAAASATLELKELLDFNFSVECQNRCAKTRGSARARIEELASIWSILAPVMLKTAPDVAPRALSGSVDLLADLRSQIGDGTAKKYDKIMDAVQDLKATGAVNIDAEVGFTDVNAVLPMNATEIKDYDGHIRLKGDFKKQLISIKQSLAQLALVLPPKKRGDKPTPVNLNRIEWVTDLSVKPETGAIAANNPLNSSMDLQSKFFVATLDASSLIPQPVNGLEFHLDLGAQSLRKISLKNASMKVRDLGAEIAVNGNAALSSSFGPEQFNAKVLATIQPKSDELMSAGVKASGSASYLMEVGSPNMEDLTVSGALEFDRFFLTMLGGTSEKSPRMIVENVSGRIPFAKALNLKRLQEQQKRVEVKAATLPTLDDLANEYVEKSSNKYKAQSNLMAVADYSTVRPMGSDQKPLSIERFVFGDLEVKQVEIDLEISQRKIALHQFVAAFIGGKIHGAASLDYDDKLLGAKVALHLTQLDTRKLIDNIPNIAHKESWMRSWAVSGSPYLDAVAHLDYDFRSLDMTGGVEITSIGKEQLNMILWYIDPKDENSNIATIRKALLVGDIKQVSVPIKNGHIGMDLDLRLFGAPIPTPKLSKIPISQIISGAVNGGKPHGA